MLVLIRKTLFLLIGLGLVVFGIIIIPLPGPGVLVILAGLWLLGEEFAIARQWRRSLWNTVRDRFSKGRDKTR